MQNIFKMITPYCAFALFVVFALSIQSCSEPADKFFDTAVLNTNTINDFATPILAKHINDETVEYPDIPSSKKQGDEATKMVQNNILYMEKSLKDIKALSAGSDDRKTIKEQSVALYEFVIPVYKNEYTNYAKLCDNKASQAEKDALIQSIDQKYRLKFETLYSALLNTGKDFAKANKLNVDWN